MAAARLQRLWAARESVKVHLPWRRATLRPGAVLGLQDRGGLWRVAATAFERMALSVDLERLPSAGPVAAPAEPGRPISEPDRPHGPTRLVLLDSPLAADRLPARPQLLLIAAGEDGWRRADLLASWDSGATWQPAGGTAPPAAMGHVVAPPAAAGSAVLDLGGSAEVELLSDTIWLESRSDAALAAGANLAAIGDELIQFGVVEPLGGRRFRLSRLLRGRRGTEWAAAGHAAGEAFALVDPDTLVLLEPPLAALGAEARVLASGLGDPAAVPAAAPISGEAVRPPSPVHLHADRRANGDVAIGWVRRSRSGWTWLDGADTPLGEEREAYRLTLTGGGSPRTVELAEPAFLYTAAAQAEDGAAGALSIAVAQLGDAAASRPATFILD
jgi:hypothetical protein